MNVSSPPPAAPVASTPPQGTSPAIVALEASMQSQAELVLTLLSVNIQNATAAQKMETAAQIIDVYA